MAAVGLLVLVPAVALAHPLGNFTINHYAGIRISSTGIALDVVLDQAEIPTFQARQDLDTNGDGDVSAEETEAARTPQCETLGRSLQVAVGGTPVPLELDASGLSFPIGAGGLPTMRLVCELRANVALTSQSSITFSDDSFSDRIGWREITVVGDGMSIAPSVPSTSVSDRLAHYPTDLLTQPLSDRTVTVTVTPGGPAAAPFVAPDAKPIAGAAGRPSSAPQDGGSAAGPAESAVSTIAGVPGGIGTEIDGLLRTNDATPLVILGSLLAAAALGAGHALTPGHGKTLMGAYLVGTRGTPTHALGLGLSVAVSHTIGILGLALLVVAAGAALPADVFQRLAPLVSALTLTAIGAWLLLGQLRRLRAARAFAATAALHGHPLGGDHDHDAPHAHAGDDEHDAPLTHDGPHADEHPHEHEHHHEGRHSDARDVSSGLTHDHGFGPHSHAPVASGRLTWRSLFLLGLAGGFVPSTNALLILLATIATNRAAFGLVLVVAFGLGMAAVMTGVGLVLIYARDWIESRPRLPALRHLAVWAPAAAAVFVVALGVVLTTEAVTGGRL